MFVEGRLLIDPTRIPVPGWIRIEAGRIAEMGEGSAPERADAGDPEAILCPGFIDAHFHVPQIDIPGIVAPDLLTWLEQAVFPAEARWADPGVAERQSNRAIRRLVRAGTLGVAGFLSPHPGSIDAFAAAHRSQPIRAIVGQARMNRLCPDELIHDAAPLPAPTERLEPSANPRFAIACDAAALAAAGREAAAGRVVQTHLAEQPAECARVRELFPDAPHYTGVYDAAGMLGRRTLLAHGVHLSEDEFALIAERGAVIVHCPTANTFLQSGLFDLALARQVGVRLALGSDVAAGPDVAMPRVARAMIEVAINRRLLADPASPVPTPAEAWSLITSGNADALGWKDAGRLDIGAVADLLLLDVPFDIDQDLIARLIFCWDDSFITGRIVAGRID